MSVIISIILGLLPEILFYNALMFKIKDIRAKRIKFIVINLVYTTILMFFTPYTILFHVLYIIGTMVQYRLFYIQNIEIIDVFALANILVLAMITNYVCFPIITISDGKYYLIGYIINRLLLVLIYFKGLQQIKTTYAWHRALWNRNDNAKIKSLTIRNISLVIVNLLIFFSFLMMQYWLQK